MLPIVRFRFWIGALVLAGLPGAATGALIRPLAPNDSQGFYPMVAASRGALAYEYDAGAQTGLLTLNNKPYMASTGTKSGMEFPVGPDFTTTLHQILTAELDDQGQLVASAANQFELRGRIDLGGGQVFDGVLLHGRPIAIGAQALDAVGVTGTDYFDAQIAVDGGLLASYFAPELYMRFISTLGSTFTGDFTESFLGRSVQSLLMSGMGPSDPAPIPEPLPAVVIGLGILWLAIRRRAREK